MSGIHGKKTEVRFTIQFSKTDPEHLDVVDILNRKAPGGKAQYIVNAVKYYENHAGSSDKKPTIMLDEKQIEAIVKKVLLDCKQNNNEMLAVAPPLAPAQTVEEIIFDDSIDAVGSSIIANTVEMLRKK